MCGGGIRVHSFCGVNGSLPACVNQTTEMTAAEKEMLAMLTTAVFGFPPAGGNRGIKMTADTEPCRDPVLCPFQISLGLHRYSGT